MANIQESSFAVDAAVGASFGGTTSNVAVPGTPASDTILKVTNLGPCHIAIKLGASIAVVVTPSTGLIILAGQSVNLTLGANTFIAGIACGGSQSSSTVNIASGN